MPNRLVWYTNDRNPSITETIMIGGTAVDLTGSTVRFKMRAIGSSTLTVDSAVSNSPGADGVVRYDWAAADVDTAGEYLVWWEVTTSGKVQAVHEAVIEIRDHGPISNVYIELEEFKETSMLAGTVFADGDVRDALMAASRAIDNATGRRFYADADANQIRYYNPLTDSFVRIDDLVTLTTLKTDPGGDGTYEETWASTDYALSPLNASANGIPYGYIERQPGGDYYFTPGTYPNTVQVTGKFGWASVPDAIKLATGIYASRLLKRVREAPFGVAGIGLDGTPVRVSAIDPDIEALIAPYRRERLFV